MHMADGATRIDKVCTHVKSLSDIHGDLASATKWAELGKQLGVDDALMTQLQKSPDNDQQKTRNVLRSALLLDV